jgi:hypothetical protein
MECTIPERLCWPKLPLAVYREIAAHLQQVEGVTVTLLPQKATKFDYELSQVGGLQIAIAGDSVSVRNRITQILQYYRSRFGDWEPCYQGGE